MHRDARAQHSWSLPSRSGARAVRGDTEQGQGTRSAEHHLESTAPHSASPRAAAGSVPLIQPYLAAFKHQL